MRKTEKKVGACSGCGFDPIAVTHYTKGYDSNIREVGWLCEICENTIRGDILRMDNTQRAVGWIANRVLVEIRTLMRELERERKE